MGEDPVSRQQNYGFSMSDLEPGSVGPFTVLGGREVGNYEGTDGIDNSFDHDARAMLPNAGFRESWSFFPLPEAVENGSQVLTGLSYTRDSWRAVSEETYEDKALHRETGYLLWDEGNRLAFRVIALPRGVTLLATASDVTNVSPEDWTEDWTRDWTEPSTSLTFVTDAGSDDGSLGGILSNHILAASVRTVRLTSKMRIASDGSKFAYKDTVEQDRTGQAEDHTDSNSLRRI